MEVRLEDFWLRLDNAAKIYPAIQNDELTSVFRISAVMKDSVKAGPLLEAIRLLEHRFPYYKVRRKAGFFWYYLEYHDGSIPLRPDTTTPCRAFGKDEFIFRVLARKKTISVEFSHILTDGTGGLEFFKSLLLIYGQQSGMPIPDSFAFLRPGDAPSPAEFEDSYNKYFEKEIPMPAKIPKAFHLGFKLSPVPRFSVLSGVVPLAPIAMKAKAYGVSITVYLVSIYLYALQEIFNSKPSIRRRANSKVLRVEVPINLRKIYPSASMRNFSVFVMPGIDLKLGSYTFEEIVKTVYHQIQLEMDRKLINKILSRNVGAERNLLVKNIPLFIKSIILFFKYKSKGTSLYSGVITNLGKIELPPGISAAIDHFVFIPPPPDHSLKVNCGVVGFDDKLAISFGNITRSKELEQRFFRKLVNEGVPVKMIHNQQ